MGQLDNSQALNQRGESTAQNKHKYTCIDPTLSMSTIQESNPRPCIPFGTTIQSRMHSQSTLIRTIQIGEGDKNRQSYDQTVRKDSNWLALGNIYSKLHDLVSSVKRKPHSFMDPNTI